MLLVILIEHQKGINKSETYAASATHTLDAEVQLFAPIDHTCLHI